MSAAVEFTLPELYAERDRRERHESLQQEAERLSTSLAEFIRAAWHVRSKRPLIPGWHIDSISDHVQAAFAGEIRKLAINVPPRTLKSETVSIFAPAWEWTTRPETRFLTASYVDKLATDFSVGSRDLIRSGWYQARWPEAFEMKSDADLKTRYFNDQGGSRIATSVGGSATGSGGDIIIIDDPHNTEEVESDTARDSVIEWHDGVIATRFNDPETGVEILIMQRVHERDLTGHVLDLDPGEWTLLCLPEEYERKHPFVYPATVTLPSGKLLRGDPRTDEGELMHPDRIGPASHAERVRRLGQYRAAGQLQQRPAAHEGSILKRTYWRYFDPTLLEDDRLHLLPRFQAVISSWDTSFKDKTTSDYVAGGTWGILAGDRYLLRLTVQRMGLLGDEDVDAGAPGLGAGAVAAVSLPGADREVRERCRDHRAASAGGAGDHGGHRLDGQDDSGVGGAAGHRVGQRVPPRLALTGGVGLRRGAHPGAGAGSRGAVRACSRWPSTMT